ncbi:MAG: O-methyltransferase [Acidobacteriota bacterium]
MGFIVPDKVERYLASLNRAADPLLEEIAAAGRAEGLPLVDAEVGAFLRVLALACGARRVLEIGTAIGYSGIWLAGALPPAGKLITIDIDPARARRARQNFARAGIIGRVDVLVGDAMQVVETVHGPFDLIYQDGAKELYTPLLDPLVMRLRPGGLLVTDNVLWDGEVVPGFIDPPHRDPASTRLIAEYNERLTTHPALITSIIPLRDGVAVAIKRG